MTNFEYIQCHDCEEVSWLLCIMNEVEFYKTHDETMDHCDYCPVTSRCQHGRNGWMDWLMEEKA